MRKNFVINGKFLLASLEGMPRVGREITKAIDELLVSQRYSHLSVKILAPKGAKDKIKLKNIEISEVGHLQGPMWEQFELPYYLGQDYCLHFTATAPIFGSNGCVVVHDAQYFSTKKSHSWKSYLLYGAVTPIVSRHYKDIITVSEYARKEILRYNVCDREDIKVIHNGADHVRHRACDASILTEHNLEPRGFMLANSYVHHHKNVKILFEALRESPDMLRKLVLFGSSGREHYKARGIDVPDEVLFVGRISDEALVGLMKSARMFLFPSTTEGFGLPPLEAMMLGCPTISASAGAMPEICGDGALYASPYSADDWKHKIRFLWNDDNECERLARAGLKTAAAFTWHKAAKKYLDVVYSQ